MVFVVVLAVWIFSLCVHEYAHARVAYAGGDTTVAEKGYLSMNPLRYMDPVYSILMPLIFLALGGIGLPGGAVYVDRSRLRGRGWNSAVSLAGPASNLALAVVLAVLLRFAVPEGSPMAPIVAFLCILQLTAVALNLLPLPPLDGYGIISPFLPPNIRSRLMGLGRWSIIIVFVLLWSVPAFGNAFWGLVFGVGEALGVSRVLAVQGLEEFMIWR